MEITISQESPKCCFTLLHRLGKFHANRGSQLKNALSLQFSCPAPFALLNLGQTSKTLIRCCTTQLKPLCKGSVTMCSVSLSTAFSAHSEDSWKGVTEEITQQARDKAFWSCTGISALLTQMKIPKLPRAAIIMLLRGFISFL